MHHHSNTGKKLSRERDQRRALVKGLATSLVMEEKIVTTKPKAKAVVPYVERLITKAKVGSLHAKRQIRAKVTTDAATNKLVSDLGPRFAKRAGGYTRTKAAGYRQGDDAALSEISFTEQPPKKENKPKSEAAKKVAKKPSAKAVVKEKADAKK